MKQRGFTLIELVVVIIILGILAVVAAPKFINLKHDALVSTIENMEGQLKSANNLVFAKAAVEHKEALEFNDYNNPTDAYLDINGKQISLHLGHIQASKWNVDQIMHIDDADWNVKGSSGLFGKVYMTPRGAPAFNAKSMSEIDQSKCYLKYYFDNKHYDNPGYDVETSGC
ncbi:type II secretion system protein [Shewanella submarina]|uniref:Type II secretion system protein n=1 Tax=Shewanella submarina TaxID=2016376 RepID=A0ABV7GF81_9GAMM|nr:type II secretion system protein [Shewanella submarina]